MRGEEPPARPRRPGQGSPGAESAPAGCPRPEARGAAGKEEGSLSGAWSPAGKSRVTGREKPGPARVLPGEHIPAGAKTQARGGEWPAAPARLLSAGDGLRRRRPGKMDGSYHGHEKTRLRRGGNRGPNPLCYAISRAVDSPVGHRSPAGQADLDEARSMPFPGRTQPPGLGGRPARPVHQETSARRSLDSSERGRGNLRPPWGRRPPGPPITGASGCAESPRKRGSVAAR